MGNRWPLKKFVQILGLLWILLGNAVFVFLMKAQITRKKINLTKLFFVNEVRVGTSNSYQYLIWLKSKNSKDIFGSSKCKVTFGFKYM